MDLSGKRVLVTGGAGFIGSHLVEALLERECRVRVLVHYNSRGSWGFLEELAPPTLARIEVVPGDIADPFSVEGAVKGCDAVFHLAALIGIPYSYLAPRSYVATNVSGTLHVLEASRRHRVARVVHTSTSETYGTARYTPIDEAHPLQGQSPYSASKIAADKLAESYHKSFDLPVATIRPFNTFGPRQSARAVIPTIVSQALRGDTVRLGSLSPVRDLTFVGDTARGFLAVAESDDALGQVINVGTGKGITIGDLASRILAVMGLEDRCRVARDEARVRPEKSEVLELLCDNSLASKLLGWSPRVSLDDGLARVVDYVRAHADRYKTEVYNV
jgi:NAD dependent epimerase/dehydratase